MQQSRSLQCFRLASRSGLIGCRRSSRSWRYTQGEGEGELPAEGRASEAIDGDSKSSVPPGVLSLERLRRARSPDLMARKPRACETPRGLGRCARKGRQGLGGGRVRHGLRRGRHRKRLGHPGAGGACSDQELLVHQALVGHAHRAACHAELRRQVSPRRQPRAGRQPAVSRPSRIAPRRPSPI
jgi:hypothetical protein